MKKQTLALSLVACIAGLAGLAFAASPVLADTCTTQYGGTTTCVSTRITINKQVQNPITKMFVDNLTTTDPTFAPGSQALFQLIVTNSSSVTIDPVSVTDVLPNYLTFVSGPGSFNSANNTLTFTLNNMTAGESRTVQVLAQVVGASQFPSGPSLFCVVNSANVTAQNMSDSDTAQVCLQNGTTTVVTKLPVAGFDDLTLLLPFAGVGLSGLVLLKGKKRG